MHKVLRNKTLKLKKKEGDAEKLQTPRHSPSVTEAVTAARERELTVELTVNCAVQGAASWVGLLGDCSHLRVSHAPISDPNSEFTQPGG